jgi:hypothetical protein
VQVLRKRYRTWPAVLRDFEPVGAASIGDLLNKGRLFLRPGGKGIHTVQEYTGLLADRYYSLCRSIVKKLDPDALYLGDRYISNFYPEVAKAAGRYADVVSTNLNADWNDGSFARFYLPALRRATGKAILITEYYFAAAENRSGNKNDSSGFPTVQTQEQRAQGFVASTLSLLHTPYVLGAHWFQYYDEPKFGRPDGENYDMGLVDVDNRPYESLVAAAKSLDLGAEHRAAPRERTDWRTGIPFLDEKAQRSLALWPRERAFAPPTGDADRGDLYAAWDDKGFWLAVYWNEDRFAEAFYNGGKPPRQSHATLDLEVGMAQLRIDLDDPKAVAARFENGVRMTAFVFVPAVELGQATMSVGMRLKLSAKLTTRNGAYTQKWTGSSTLVR